MIFRMKKGTLLVSCLFIALLVLISFSFRSDLSYKIPFHTDESTQAWILQEGMKLGYIKYDPLHHHGPAPLYLRQLFLGFQQSSDWGEWTEPGLRRSGIYCSILTLVLFFVMLVRYSVYSALLTGLLFAFHPYLIYYHTQAIHEPIFVFFGIALLSSLHYAKLKSSFILLLVAGIFAGLFQSSKETWVLLPVCAFFAWGVNGSLRSFLPLFIEANRAIYFFLGAILISVLLYSGFFQDLHGIFNSWATFWSYQTEEGHTKPFFWYFQSLFGLFPLNLPLLLCSLVWVIPWIPLKNKSAVPCWVCVWKWIALFQLISYSLIPYKTPWLLLLAWTLIIPAAGCQLDLFLRSSYWHKRLGILMILLLGIGFYVLQWNPLSASLYPYSYSATSTEIHGVLEFVRKKQRSVHREIRIAVEGDSYWPLPWYLRGYPSVGYFEHEAPEGFDYIMSVEPQLTKESRLDQWELRENIAVTLIDCAVPTQMIDQKQ